MVYKIIYTAQGKLRGENYDRKTYKDRTSAVIALQKYNHEMKKFGGITQRGRATVKIVSASKKRPSPTHVNPFGFNKRNNPFW